MDSALFLLIGKLMFCTTNANLYHYKGEVFGLLIYVTVGIFRVSSSKIEKNQYFWGLEVYSTSACLLFNFYLIKKTFI